MASTTPRRTVDDWVKAGLRLLADEGLQAVKIDRLCKSLGVTKGSFYWHFEDIGAFLGALQQEWTDSRARQRDIYAGEDSDDPRARMELLMELLLDPDEVELERAMREWARTDERVRDRIHEWDRWVVRELRGAFKELGFDGDDVEMRARTLFVAGIGYLHSAPRGGRAGSSAQRALLMDLMTKR